MDNAASAEIDRESESRKGYLAAYQVIRRQDIRKTGHEGKTLNVERPTSNLEKKRKAFKETGE